MRQLNQSLRPRFIASFQVHLGSRVEADVAEFDRGPGVTHTIATFFPDDIGVQILDTRDGAVLVAVVELVSPRNKDRRDAREAFVSKCTAYLHRGIGVVVVDVVTSRGGNLHNERMDRWQQSAARMGADPSLSAVAYRPVHRDEKNEIDIWASPLTVGQTLPTLPLALRDVGCVPLDLESTYTQAR